MRSRIFIGLAITIGLFTGQAALAAQRTVLFEHFTEDLCAYCPPVAAAVADFRSHYTPQQTAIISFCVAGSDPIDHGSDRRDYYDKLYSPQLIGDGQGDFEALMPIAESDIISYYNTRTGVSAPLTMEVFKESNTQYRIHLQAETALSLALVAVAYEDVTHDEVHYPCYGRKFLTEYYGDEFSIAAGESRDFVKTLSIESGWNPSTMGVVAWVHEVTKDGRGFRAHPVLQAADSKASHGNPTATPTQSAGTPTPVPPTSTPATNFTPTPTPTFSQTDLQQELILNKTNFKPNDDFLLKVRTRNPASSAVAVDQYIALQVIDSFYFWPSWSVSPNCGDRSYNAGCDMQETILEFVWPSGAGSFSPLYFWLVSLRADTSTLAGPFDSAGWEYSE
jgi:hypothetical protein